MSVVVALAHLGMGYAVGDGVGSGVGAGVGLGVGDGVGSAVGDGVGAAVGDGVGLRTHTSSTQHAPINPGSLGSQTEQAVRAHVPCGLSDETAGTHSCLNASC